MDINKGKKLISAVDSKQKVSDELDRVFETELTDETEREWDRAYKAYWDAVNDLAAFLVENIPGLDEVTAKKMALHKRDEIKALFDRAQ